MTFGLEQHIIDKIITVFEANARVDKAYVFGSRAKGNYRPDSDIDIAIKGIDITLDDILKMSVAFEDKGIKTKIDLIDYTSIKEPALQEHIDRVGIEFYSRWKEYKLDEVYDFASGLSKGAEEFGFGYEFLAFKDIFQNYFVPNKLTSLVNSTEKERKSCSIKRGDVFLTRTSETDEDLGMSCVALKDYPEATFNGFTKRLRPNGKIEIHPEYAGFYFRTPKFRFTVAGMSSVTTRASLNNSMLAQLTIAIPPIIEQKAIADTLITLHDKIDLLQRQNKTLEQLAETLFRQWFVAEAKEYEMGCLGDAILIFDNLRVPVSSMERDKKKFGKLYPYYGAAKIMDYINDYIFDGEYILMGEDGTVQTEDGFPILQMPTGKFWVNNHTHVLQAKKPYSNYLLYIFLKQTKINHIVTGAVQPKINQENLKSLDFPILPDDKIVDFVNNTTDYWKKIKSNQTQIRTLTQTRDTLLPKLMSGEVRVELEDRR